MAGRVWLGIMALMFAALGGCQNEDFYIKQREEAAGKHFDEIKKLNVPANKTFTLEECINYALKNNLDLKVYRLKEAVSSSERYAEILKMLPESNVSLELTQRSNQNASQSIDVRTGQQSLVMSRSSERHNEKFNVDIAFSAVDFGLAYLSSVQAQDRVLLNRQLERRAAQNLILDVVKAYFHLASTQDAYESTGQLIQKCRDIDKVLQGLADSKSVSPLRILDERKRFIRLEDTFMNFRRSHQKAIIELRSLMGVAPGGELKVDTAILNKIDPAILSLPDIYFLEKVALRQRPELSQLDIQHHLTVIESDKTIIKMFPNVKAFMDFTQDNNKFLYNHSWTEIGIRAAYNAARIPAHFVEYKALKSEEKELEIRSLALSFGVVGQVRVAFRNIDEVYRRYMLDEKFYKNYQAQLEIVRNTYSSGGGDIKKLDLDRMELETVENQIYRTMALSNCYLSYFRLLNAVGIEPRSFKEANRMFAELKIKLIRELPYCLGQHYVRDDGVIVYNGVDFVTGFETPQREEVDQFARAGFKVPQAPVTVKPRLRAVSYGGPTWVEHVWGGFEDSLDKVIAVKPVKETPRGFVRKDGVTVYNGIELKNAKLTEQERQKLEMLTMEKGTKKL